MGNNRWNPAKFGDVIQINPRRALRRTEVAFHVPMRDVEVLHERLLHIRTRNSTDRACDFKMEIRF